MSESILRLLAFALGGCALLSVVYIFIKNQPPHYLNVFLGLFAVAFVAMGMNYNFVVTGGADGSFSGRLEQMERQIAETSEQLEASQRELATTRSELSNTRQGLKSLVQSVTLVSSSDEDLGGTYTATDIDPAKWADLQKELVKDGILTTEELPATISQQEFFKNRLPIIAYEDKDNLLKKYRLENKDKVG